MAVSEISGDWQPELVDLSPVAAAFGFEEGFSRPDWKVIERAIDQTAAPEDLDTAWSDAAIQWLLKLKTDLGGEYRLTCSKEFLLVSTQDFGAASDLLCFAETTLEKIYSALKEAAWQWGHGKHVILLFAEDDDYYQYVSYFYGEGVHPASGGCLIHQDYAHIAMFMGDGRSIRTMLAHELTHNSVVHLQLPLWLNEGLAVLFQRTASEWQAQVLEEDLRERHFAFWNPETIQEFWAGVSFGKPGEPNELSYSLAEILVRLLLQQPEHFGGFVQNARWEDAGQTAALDWVGQDLGILAATFLGEGNWRPSRKAIVACWKAANDQESGQ